MRTSTKLGLAWKASQVYLCVCQVTDVFMSGRRMPERRDVADVSPNERLVGKVVREELLKTNRLIYLEYTLGGPTLIISGLVKMDEVHPIGAVRHFCVGWRWCYREQSWCCTAKYLSEG